jgi:hypothetical protein
MVGERKVTGIQGESGFTLSPRISANKN